MANYTWSKNVNDIWSDFTTICHPSKIICFGATHAGKSHWAINLIKRRDALFSQHIDHVYIIYGSRNSEQYHELWHDPNVTMSSSDPDTILEEIYAAPGNKLLFIDGKWTMMTLQQK